MWISRSEYERLKEENEVLLKKNTIVPSYMVRYIENNDVRCKFVDGFLYSGDIWVSFTNKENELVTKFKTDLVIRIERV